MTNKIFGAFKQPSFSYLWLSEIFTQIAFNLFNFFLILHVFELTKSNTAVSLIVVTFTLPAILFGILAGILVDRWSKKRVLLFANILRGIIIIPLAFFINDLALVFIISFLISVITQFFVPAETPLIPLVVPKDILFSANAMFGLGLYGSILVAYLISGPVILFLGAKYTLLFLSILFLISAVFTTGIKLDHPGKKKKALLRTSKAAMMDEVKSAITMMKASKPIYNSLFLLALSQILLLVLAVIAPGYATQILKVNVNNFPILFIAPAALGVLVGAVVLATFFHDRSREKLSTAGLFLSGIAMFLLPYGANISARQIIQTLNGFLPKVIDITTLHIVVVIAFVLGFANAFVFVPSNTILQEKTSDEFRGKIYGVLNALVGIFSLIPILVVGSLSDIFGIEKVIVGIAVILLSLGVSRVLFDF
ncbi:MAG: MFS transporter [Candidatus Levybacteria bacterium]|nr:MFS transporter [Candidatus Levybacteria bacterium]